MHISNELHEAIWFYSHSCVGFLHVPKAAGTTVRRALERTGAFLDIEIVETPHGPDCSCSAPRCQARRSHERSFLRQIKRERGPWCLNFGHRPITGAELQSLPEGLRILVPLRPTQDRIESYLRYYFLMANAASKSHVITFNEKGVTWNLQRSTGRAQVPRLSFKWSDIETVRGFRYQSPVYVNPDSTVALRRWIADAMSEHARPFYYRDFLPDLTESFSLHAQFLRPMGIPQLMEWLRQKFNVRPTALNRSSGLRNPWLDSTDLTEFPRIARQFSQIDDESWEILNSLV